MKRRNTIITLILTLSMVFSTSAFVVFADTAADQDGEQLAKDTPAAEELVNETPEEPAAVTEQAEEVQEQGTEATENGGVTEAEEPTAETKKAYAIRIGNGGIENASDNGSGEGWTYVGSTKTLTLNNCTVDGNGYVVFYGTDLNIVLEGNNTIKGIRENGTPHKLVISGNGSLTINGSGSDTYREAGLYAGTVEINGGNITLNKVYDGITAHIVEINGGNITVNGAQDDVIQAYTAEIRGGNIKISDAGACMVADNVNISGGVVRATGNVGIIAFETISFSGDIYVDVETKGVAQSENNKYYIPAVVCYKEDGIKLSDDVQIVLPENGKIAPYSGIEATSVTINALGDGATIADASGKAAKHVIIDRVKNPSGVLLSKAVAKGKTNMELSWTAMNDVDGYDVFFAPCNKKGKKYEPALVASVDNGTTSYTVSSLKKGTPYKAYVQAYITKQGAKQYVGTSLTTHAFAGGSSKKFTNPKSVKVKKAKVSIKKGKTYKIRASVRKLKKGKRLISKAHAPKLRYLSSDTSIATVSKKGKIKAVAPGSCTVYAIAANGVYKTVSVTVK